MIVNGKEWVVDHPLSKRWPLYTRGNVGEVFPDVVTPLTWSLCGQAFEDGWRSAWTEFGLVAPGDFDVDRVLVAVAGGYCYLNMSYIRLLGVRTPGGHGEGGRQEPARRGECAEIPGRNRATGISSAR